MKSIVYGFLTLPILCKEAFITLFMKSELFQSPWTCIYNPFNRLYSTFENVHLLKIRCATILKLHFDSEYQILKWMYAHDNMFLLMNAIFIKFYYNSSCCSVSKLHQFLKLLYAFWLRQDNNGRFCFDCKERLLMPHWRFRFHGDKKRLFKKPTKERK